MARYGKFHVDRLREKKFVFVLKTSTFRKLCNLLCNHKQRRPLVTDRRQRGTAPRFGLNVHAHKNGHWWLIEDSGVRQRDTKIGSLVWNVS